jgi:hypothetical protein
MGTTETIVYQALNEFKRLKLIGAQIGFMHGAVNGASWTGCSIATNTQCGQKKTRSRGAGNQPLERWTVQDDHVALPAWTGWQTMQWIRQSRH